MINSDLLHHRHGLDNFKINMEEPPRLNISTSLFQPSLPHQDLNDLNHIPSNWGHSPPYPTQSNSEQNYQNKRNPSKPYQPKVTIWNLNRVIRRMGIYVPNPFCTKMWCVRDCGGYIAAGFTWILIFLGELMILMNCMTTNVNIFSLLNAFTSIAAATLGFFSHCQAMFSDPVSFSRNYQNKSILSHLEIKICKLSNEDFTSGCRSKRQCHS